MTLKTAASSCVFAATQSAGTIVKSTILLADLQKLIASPNMARVLALTEGGIAPPPELLVTEIYIQAVEDRKKVVLVYKGEACPIAGAIGAWARNTNTNIKPFEQFSPEHGLEIEFTYENGGTAYTSYIVWDLQNDHAPQLSFGSVGAAHIDPSISFFLQEVREQLLGFASRGSFSSQAPGGGQP